MNSPVASAIAGGWNLGAIVAWASGSPNNISTGTDRSNTGEGFDRPNVVPGVSAKLSGASKTEWFNVQAFAEQAQYTYGNTERNSVIGPQLHDVDSSVTKNMSFTERLKLQLRLDAFNTFNQPNFGAPNLGLTADHLDAKGVPIPGSGSFGTITGLNGNVAMRQLQVSLKFVF